MYICLCKGIKESQVKELGLKGIVDPEQLATLLGLYEEGCCGRCIQNIDHLANVAANELVDFAKS